MSGPKQGTALLKAIHSKTVPVCDNRQIFGKAGLYGWEDYYSV